MGKAPEHARSIGAGGARDNFACMVGTRVKRYFISRHGRQAGPYTKEQLRSLGISAGTPVWCEEAFDWKQADSFPELKDVLDLPPPAAVHRGPLHWLRIGRKR